MAKTINGEAQLHTKVDDKKIIVTESSVRRDLRLADEEDEDIHKELCDRLVRAATTASSLEAEHDSAQALKALKTSKPKVKGVVFQELEEPIKPKKKDQIRLDEEAAKKLQAKFDEKERLAREKAKKEERANIALIEEWDDIQAKINVDHRLAKRLQAQEQEELSDVENATLFQ
nr:hypothetical protein [Tanacetum cinerariifolium]